MFSLDTELTNSLRPLIVLGQIHQHKVQRSRYGALPVLALAGHRVSPPLPIRLPNSNQVYLGEMEAQNIVYFAPLTSGSNDPSGKTGKEKLDKAVTDTYMSKLAKSIVPSFYKTGINIVFREASEANIYIVITGIDTCTAQLSDVVPVAKGIFCRSDQTCTYSREVTLSQSYSSTLGIKAGAIISAKALFKSLR